MRVYLEEGCGGMRASLFILPHKLQHFSMNDNAIPEVVRTHSHILRIIGEDDEVMDIEGSLPELQELVRMMGEALKGAKE